MAASAQINFPESGRGLGDVTATIFGSTVGYPSDSLASCVTFFWGWAAKIYHFNVHLLFVNVINLVIYLKLLIVYYVITVKTIVFLCEKK